MFGNCPAGPRMYGADWNKSGLHSGASFVFSYKNGTVIASSPVWFLLYYIQQSCILNYIQQSCTLIRCPKQQ